MTNPDYWWEPPLAGTEVEHLLASLDRLRTTFRWKADDLDAAGLSTRIGASSLTLGGLLKHLAWAEDLMWTKKLSLAPQNPPWDTAPFKDQPDWEFASAADDAPDALYALYDTQVVRSRETVAKALAEGGLDRVAADFWGNGMRMSLRRMLFDLVEEYGRHTGHADLLREAVDGRVGEDPPQGWSPVSNPAGGFRPV